MNEKPITTALEKHWRVAELAKQWGVCSNTIIRLFRHEPGVVRISRGRNVMLLIPESVVLRVHQRLSNQPLQSVTARRNPLGVVALGYRYATVSQKPRYVLKTKPLKQFPHGKRIAESVGPAVGDST